jgi:hypothetical protein
MMSFDIFSSRWLIANIYSINDYKVSREFEKNDLIQRLSNFSQNPPPQGF